MFESRWLLMRWVRQFRLAINVNTSSEAPRAGDLDDLVLAVAMAC